MFLAERVHRTAASAVLAGLIVLGLCPVCLDAQESAAGPVSQPLAQPSSIALPLPEDRGAAALEQTLKRLGTTASVLMIVAHPDDEDGALLAYLSRGLGVRATLFTLTRGEGGQNAMSAEDDDALGIIRTNELLKADEYYGAQQMWGTEADFGFSKTQEEAFARWGHERVLYDAVLAVRRARPQIIVATFVGGVSDGHGQHQVSGEIAQEVFKAAADPKVFPDQIADGYQPWQPLAVYSMVPFAPVTDKGMFDYATGKWAPARFHNYATDEWINGEPSTDVTLPVGTRDAALGRSYQQIARDGWGMQKSQNGGANPTLSGPGTARYHLWVVADSARPVVAKSVSNDDLFHNSRVDVDTSISGLARLVPEAPAWLTDSLQKLDQGVTEFKRQRASATGAADADALAPLYREALDLRARVAGSSIEKACKASLLFELDAKLVEIQQALVNLLGLDLTAFRTYETHVEVGGFRGNSADETPRSIAPGETFRVRVHVAQSTSATQLAKVWLQSTTGSPWSYSIASGTIESAGSVSDPIYTVHAADDAQPTAPYFTRPSVEQPFYDVSSSALRGHSFAPYPLAAWAQFDFHGLPIRLGQVVQTLQRLTGPGGIYEPLVITPAVGVSIEPDARILPLDGSKLPVRVRVHAERATDGSVSLKLPEGWQCKPASAPFHRAGAGDTEPITFEVTPGNVKAGAYSIEAVAEANGRAYGSGWRNVAYEGLRPYNEYKKAELRTRKVDVTLAQGLRIGYIMGTGDRMPEAIEGLGASVHMLSDSELTTADLSTWNVIVVGIRAYSVRPQLAAAQTRLNEFVRNGGTFIVQYQSSNFPAPFPLTMGRIPERVVDEQSPVKILAPNDSLLNFPNRLTSADFDGWVEERGHSFLDSWDPAYTALTETADPGQDPQRGGLLVAHAGKGTYVYVAYALYRQLPELVPGSYRILANLLSAGQSTRQVQ